MPAEEFGRVFTAPEGVRIDTTFVPQPDGRYIEFQPTGRADPGTVTVSDNRGRTFTIACWSATETYHVATAQELREHQGQ